MDFQQKYLKYKSKYNLLKNQLKGGIIDDHTLKRHIINFNNIATGDELPNCGGGGALGWPDFKIEKGKDGTTTVIYFDDNWYVLHTPSLAEEKEYIENYDHKELSKNRVTLLRDEKVTFDRLDFGKRSFIRDFRMMEIPLDYNGVLRYIEDYIYHLERNLVSDDINYSTRNEQDFLLDCLDNRITYLKLMITNKNLLKIDINKPLKIKKIKTEMATEGGTSGYLPNSFIAYLYFNEEYERRTKDGEDFSNWMKEHPSFRGPPWENYPPKKEYDVATIKEFWGKNKIKYVTDMKLGNSDYLELTPLQLSIIMNNIEVVKILLEFGARIDTPIDGIDLIQFATDNNLFEIKILLIKYHGTPEQKELLEKEIETLPIKNIKEILEKKIKKKLNDKNKAIDALLIVGDHWHDILDTKEFYEICNQMQLEKFNEGFKFYNIQNKDNKIKLSKLFKYLLAHNNKEKIKIFFNQRFVIDLIDDEFIKIAIYTGNIYVIKKMLEIGIDLHIWIDGYNRPIERVAIDLNDTLLLSFLWNNGFRRIHTNFIPGEYKRYTYIAQ
jgi:ankyrin repeat protein